MTQVFALAVAEYNAQNSKILAIESELSSFSFFQRGSVQEFLQFFITTVTGRTTPGNRAKVEQDSKVLLSF
jgi:synaptobrevin family protein YKT6